MISARNTFYSKVRKKEMLGICRNEGISVLSRAFSTLRKNGILSNLNSSLILNLNVNYFDEEIAFTKGRVIFTLLSSAGR